MRILAKIYAAIKVYPYRQLFLVAAVLLCLLAWHEYNPKVVTDDKIFIFIVSSLGMFLVGRAGPWDKK
jgi:hypothetical protein